MKEESENRAAVGPKPLAPKIGLPTRLWRGRSFTTMCTTRATGRVTGPVPIQAHAISRAKATLPEALNRRTLPFRA